MKKLKSEVMKKSKVVVSRTFAPEKIRYTHKACKVIPLFKVQAMFVSQTSISPPCWLDSVKRQVLQWKFEGSNCLYALQMDEYKWTPRYNLRDIYILASCGRHTGVFHKVFIGRRAASLSIYDARVSSHWLNQNSQLKTRFIFLPLVDLKKTSIQNNLP